jgi:hypothetical protein
MANAEDDPQTMATATMGNRTLCLMVPVIVFFTKVEFTDAGAPQLKKQGLEPIKHRLQAPGTRNYFLPKRRRALVS